MIRRACSSKVERRLYSAHFLVVKICKTSERSVYWDERKLQMNVLNKKFCSTTEVQCILFRQSICKFLLLCLLQIWYHLMITREMVRKGQLSEQQALRLRCKHIQHLLFFCISAKENIQQVRQRYLLRKDATWMAAQVYCAIYFYPSGSLWETRVFDLVNWTVPLTLTLILKVQSFLTRYLQVFLSHFAIQEGHRSCHFLNLDSNKAGDLLLAPGTTYMGT